MRRSFGAGAAVACALVVLVGQASAQQESTYVEKKTNDGQDIRFKDDVMGAIANDPVGAQITGFHPPKRFDLMRPRKTWVPELLKSVENL
jgi:hypothetical protein